MNTFKVVSNSLEETHDLGLKLASLCQKGDVLCLLGGLGAGKTHLVKGVADGLEIKPENVTSPTFVLMNEYEGKLPVYHFDLYRLDDQGQIALIGYDEFLYGDGVAVVEWADRLGELTPKEYLSIELKHLGETQREINITAHGSRYEKILGGLK